MLVVIPKSVLEERIIENFNIFDFKLSREDMDAIATPDQEISSFFDHRDPEIVKSLSSVKIDDSIIATTGEFEFAIVDHSYFFGFVKRSG